jgi:uncharacterized protein (DUF2336 family)
VKWGLGNGVWGAPTPSGRGQSPGLADSVAANWFARDLKMRRGVMTSLTGALASLGAGTPNAVAAKMAYPERTVVPAWAMARCG